MVRTKRRLHFQTDLSSVHVMNDSQNYPINDHVYCQRLHENAGYFSNELRAPNGNSLGEVSREFISQNAHGGIYIKRPMPANIFYYRVKKNVFNQ